MSVRLSALPTLMQTCAFLWRLNGNFEANAQPPETQLLFLRSTWETYRKLSFARFIGGSSAQTKKVQ